MKNQNRKRVLPLDYIRQKQNEQSQSKQSKQKRQKRQKSSGSSDFSQFQLNLKDNNKIFKPFKKPKFWRNQSDVSKSVQKLEPKNRQQGNNHKTKKRKEKHDHKKQSNLNEQKNKKIDDKNLQIVSFKMNQSHEPNLFIKVPQKQVTKQSKQQLYSEELIAQYDKKQFNNKSPQRQPYNYEKKQIQSRSKQRSVGKQHKEINDGQQEVLKETSGGVCFDVTITDFVRNQESPKKNSKRAAKRSLIVVDVNSKQEIVKRRKKAFQFGYKARKINFGYY